MNHHPKREEFTTKEFFYDDSFKDYTSEAYNAGLEAAKNGNNINNCYPYVKEKGEGYLDWLEGYRSYKPNKFTIEKFFQDRYDALPTFLKNSPTTIVALSGSGKTNYILKSAIDRGCNVMLINLEQSNDREEI